MDELDHSLGAGAGRLAGPQEQQVEIGKGRQNPTPIAADRQKAEAILRRRMQDLGGDPPQVDQHGVGGGGVETRRLGPVDPALQPPGDAGAVDREAFAQNGGDGGAGVRRRSGFNEARIKSGRRSHADHRSTPLYSAHPGGRRDPVLWPSLDPSAR
ncbi:hypothetical protein D3C73_911530 [compost metagenome]